jgi:DNA polymerase elongation subunit (family B)
MKFYTNVFYDGRRICYRGIEDNRHITDSFSFQPSLFVPSGKPSTLNTIDGRPVERISFDSLHEMTEFKKTYDNVSGFDIHGDIGVEYQYIASEHRGSVEYDFSRLKIMYIDIETTCEDGFPEISNPKEKVIAITCMVGNRKTVFCLGLFKTEDDTIAVREYDDESQLLYDFVKYFKQTSPDIVTGWNIRLFDIPYLVSRLKELEIDPRELSPWNIIRDKKIDKGGKEYLVYDIIGISTVDYYELYKTFTYVNQESYRLDHIAWVELGERKISYEEYESISDFYKKNFQKFIEYNIKDVLLVERLEQKMKLMELAVALAYSAGVNFNDVFSQVRTWDVIIYNHLLRKNIVVPPKKISSKDTQYAGAYVKEPLVGMHKWVVSFDIASMYPSSIMQYNISPETFVEQISTRPKASDIIDPSEEMENLFNECKDNGLSLTANGACFTNSRHGFLPELMDKMFKERKQYKNKMIEAKKNLEAVNEELKKRGIK